MGLLDPNLFTNPVLLNQLKGLLGNMPIAQLMRGEAEVSREGLLGEMRKIPVFDPSVSDEFMGNAMNAMTPMGALTFAGIGAKTANKAALKVAEGMEAAGKPRDAIWSETGWFKGPDGKWRFEIDDSKAAIDWRGEGAAYGKAGDFLKHKDTFKAYPSLKKIETSTEGKAGSSYYRPFQDREAHGLFDIQEEMKILGRDPQDMKSAALHETQHAIQDREGFARGGSMNEFRDVQPMSPDDDFIRKIDAQIDAAREAGNRAEYKKLSDYRWGLLTPDPFSSYRRLAGEAEARAVQARMDFPMDKRRAIPPWESYDIPWDQLIVR